MVTDDTHDTYNTRAIERKIINSIHATHIINYLFPYTSLKARVTSVICHHAHGGVTYPTTLLLKTFLLFPKNLATKKKKPFCIFFIAERFFHNTINTDYYRPQIYTN